MGVGLNTLYHRFLSKSSTVCCEFGAGGGPLELYEGTKQDRKLIFSNEFMGYDRRDEAFFLAGKPSTDISSDGAKSFSAGVSGSLLLSTYSSRRHTNYTCFSFRRSDHDQVILHGVYVETLHAVMPRLTKCRKGNKPKSNLTLLLEVPQSIQGLR